MKKIILILIGISISYMTYEQTANYDEIISKKKKGLIIEYISKTGDVYKVGDTLILGPPFRNEVYDFIKQNAGIAQYPLEAGATGSHVIIKKMRISMKVLMVNTTSPDGMVYPLQIYQLENAIEMDEVKKKGVLSSDEALVKLKKEKEKLDLGIITQAEYDKKKEELMKYIK